ncbi:MAG: hypothetical protein HC772_15240 [Leptolyngbyaceae cyanobacterium CRU_2_3]|nr:hypothetical protein [Leptolyngbyaceae cyanobacterium CRU_2_3]
MATHQEVRSIRFRLVYITTLVCLVASLTGTCGDMAEAGTISSISSPSSISPIPPTLSPSSLPITHLSVAHPSITHLSVAHLSIAQTYRTAEPIPSIAVESSNRPWFYQGVVQLAYAGAIAWIIALLQKSGK